MNYYSVQRARPRFPNTSKSVQRNRNFKPNPGGVSTSPGRRLQGNSLWSNWIDRDDGFLFQVIGISILTVALILSLQSYLSVSTVSTVAQAQDVSQNDVHLLVNFTAQNSNDTSQTSKLQEIQPPQPPTQVEIPVASQQQKDITYTVEAGDNLYDIAQKNKISLNTLAEANSLQLPYSLQVGQTLKIPQ